MNEVHENWKQAVLFDFGRWLETLPEDVPEDLTKELPAVDLHALVSGFLALRQEVRLQSRTQARAVRGLEQAIEICEPAGVLSRLQAETADALKVQVRTEAERQCVMLFLDVRDALVRGHEAAVRLASRRGIWRRPPEGVEGVVQGYEMAIERFDRTLGFSGIVRVPTVGTTFDAKTMTAVDVRTVDGVADEEVLAESRSGFVQNGVILRLAEVVVNRVRTFAR